MHQKIEVIGRLGKDPESRYTPSGQQVTSFSVATDHQYTNGSGEKIKETTWFRVSVWGKSAQACAEYLKKGSLVFVEGRLTPDKETGGPRLWTKTDGTQSASFEITASNVRFLSARGESQTAHEDSQAQDSEEVPF